MTDQDREVWNQRYREGAYGDRTYASEVLRQWLPEDARGRALDIACGNGRNAHYLATRGFCTTGVDISDVAIDRARQLNRRGNTSVHYVIHDLDQGLPVWEPFDFISMIRFVDRKIIANVDRHLNPGGYFLVELHMKYECDRPLAGPRTGRFRVESGEIQSLLTSLQVLKEFEGLLEDPDGRPSAVVRILARKTS